MRAFFRAFVFVGLLFVALTAASARAEVPDMRPDKLQAAASHIFNGKLARIYSTIAQSTDWETTYSVAEIQLARVEKGVYAGQLVYVRFWRKRFRGKGEAPDGAYGHRQVPGVGSEVRAFVTTGEDGGYDVILPNGISLISAPSEPIKKTSESG
jgi:hypothetical protein